MTRFQAFALITTLLTFGLVVLGGVVRITDSGLGCPDWPRCHGSFIPPAKTEIWIEWSHRLAASVVGTLILVLAIAGWRTQRQNPLIIGAAGASLVILVVQVILGAITVREELPAEVVATHLVTGLALLSVLIVLTISSFAEEGSRAALTPVLSFLAMTMALALGVMWLGAYMTESGANFACDGWPRCNGSFLPEFTSLVRIHWLHRALAALLGVALLLLTFQQRSLHGRGSRLAGLAHLALVIYVVQVLVGAGNIWSDMSEATSITHLILSSTIWAVLVSMLTLTLYARPQPASPEDERRPLARARA